jgi:MFS family permease
LNSPLPNTNPDIEAGTEPILSPTIKRPWKRWLLAFDAYNLSVNTLFASAIWVIYLSTRGYSPLAIGLFEMTFHIAKFVAEVPTGIFADLLGRRKSLVIFCLLSALQNLLFLYPTPPLMVLSFILAGAAFAFRGGADEAILWNIAAHADPSSQSQRYSRLVSRLYLVGLIGEIIGTASGGYLGQILVVLPFICQATLTALGAVPLLFIPEQKATFESHEPRPNPFSHFRSGIQAVRRQPVLLGLLLISGLTTSCWQTIYFYYQLYLHGLGFTLALIGIVVAVSTASNFLFTAAAPWFMRLMRPKWLIITFVFCELLGLLLMSTNSPVFGVLGYLLFFQASTSVLTPAISTYINERSPEAQRATILSFQTGLFSAAMIVLFPLFGLGVSHIAYSTVYLWTLVALAIGSIATFLVTRLPALPEND